ncbi:hypothetical protein ACFX14_044020 [Malus domestica]
MQRKEYLLSNHLSSYDPSGIQQVLPGSFENEVAGWLNLSSTLYDPFSQGPSSNADPSTMAQCHVSVTNASDGELSSWPQAYTTSSGHPSTLISPTLLPQYQHSMVGSNMAEIMPHEQVEIPVSSSSVQAYNEAADYNHENKVPQLNGH